MNNPLPCKHLDHNPEHYPSCKLETAGGITFWRRKSFYEGQPILVQFCKKRGRINEIAACYDPDEMHCYEPLEGGEIR